MLPNSSLVHIYCSPSSPLVVSRCITIFDPSDISTLVTIQTSFQKKNQGKTGKKKRKKEKKNFLPGRFQKITVQTSVFKRSRAPFNYSTGIQQFPVLSPSWYRSQPSRRASSRKQEMIFSL